MTSCREAKLVQGRCGLGIAHENSFAWGCPKAHPVGAEHITDWGSIVPDLKCGQPQQGIVNLKMVA
jgi:hypothetical protein